MNEVKKPAPQPVPQPTPSPVPTAKPTEKAAAAPPVELDRTTPPPILTPQRIDIQRPERIVMPNGVKLNVLNDEACADVTRIDLLMDGGRWQQQLPLQALFTNRMLREGTTRFTAHDIAEQLDYYGAWLELSVAAQHAHIALYSLNKYLPQTLDLLQSIVMEPTFPQQELDVIVDSNRRRFIVNCSRVDFMAHRHLLNRLFGGAHPHGLLVTPEDYNRVEPGLLRDFYQRHYHSRNSTVYLSGRVTDDCLSRIERIFGSTPFGEGFITAERKVYAACTSPVKRTFIHLPQTMQSGVRMGLLTIDCLHPDFLKLKVLVTLLGGYFGSRLMANIREDKGYTYGIAANLSPYPGGCLLEIGAETANQWVDPLIREVYREIERLQNDPVGEDELTMVKNYMVGEMCRGYESLFSLADAWMYVQVYGHDDDYFDHSLQAVRDISSDDLLRLSRTYLNIDAMREVVCGEGKPGTP